MQDFVHQPYNKDPTILGTVLGSPIFGNSYVCMQLFSNNPAFLQCCRLRWARWPLECSSYRAMEFRLSGHAGALSHVVVEIRVLL